MGGKPKQRTKGLITSPHYISSPRPFLRAPPLLESSLRTSALYAHPPALLYALIPPHYQPHHHTPPLLLPPSGRGREETLERKQGVEGRDFAIRAEPPLAGRLYGNLLLATWLESPPLSFPAHLPLPPPPRGPPPRPWPAPRRGGID